MQALRFGLIARIVPGYNLESADQKKVEIAKPLIQKEMDELVGFLKGKQVDADYLVHHNERELGPLAYLFTGDDQKILPLIRKIDARFKTDPFNMYSTMEEAHQPVTMQHPPYQGITFKPIDMVTSILYHQQQYMQSPTPMSDFLLDYLNKNQVDEGPLKSVQSQLYSSLVTTQSEFFTKNTIQNPKGQVSTGTIHDVAASFTESLAANLKGLRIYHWSYPTKAYAKEGMVRMINNIANNYFYAKKLPPEVPAAK